MRESLGIVGIKIGKATRWPMEVARVISIAESNTKCNGKSLALTIR